jgi:hypothetical protein
LSQHLKREISPIVQTLSFFPLSARVCASPFNRAPQPSQPFLAMPFLLDFILSHSLAISGAFVALYFVLCALYQLCFSPLCDIPGPWYAAISDFWLTTHVLRLQQCRTIDALFKKYGPVVRVGPNKVVFNDLSTTKNVYSILKFDKSSYYKSLLTFAFSRC